jgi:hypothetical protein
MLGQQLWPTQDCSRHVHDHQSLHQEQVRIARLSFSAGVESRQPFAEPRCASLERSLEVIQFCPLVQLRTGQDWTANSPSLPILVANSSRNLKKTEYALPRVSPQS